MKTDRTRQRAVAGGILFALAAVILAATIIFYFANRTPASANVQGEDDYLYTIMDYEGHVSVIRYGEKEPYEIFDTYTNSLPEIDQQQLREGVRIYSDAQLQKAVEDYTS